MAFDYSAARSAARRDAARLQILREKRHSPRVLCLVKLSIKHKNKDKVFKTQND